MSIYICTIKKFITHILSFFFFLRCLIKYTFVSYILILKWLQSIQFINIFMVNMKYDYEPHHFHTREINHQKLTLCYKIIYLLLSQPKDQYNYVLLSLLIPLKLIYFHTIPISFINSFNLPFCNQCSSLINAGKLKIFYKMFVCWVILFFDSILTNLSR